MYLGGVLLGLGMNFLIVKAWKYNFVRGRVVRLDLSTFPSRKPTGNIYFQAEHTVLLNCMVFFECLLVFLFFKKKGDIYITPEV